MFRYFIFIILINGHCLSQNLAIKIVNTNVEASFRGLSIVNDNIAWVSGNGGTIGRSINGGKDWNFNIVSGFEKQDFRSIYGFDSAQAIIALAGSPAVILRTKDGGRTWNEVYRDNHPDAFFDGIDFWNEKEGIIYGDPVDGKLLVLVTADGGHTWNIPEGEPLVTVIGEASFAASGTNIHCSPNGKVIIATGGIKSRLWISDDKGKNWRFLETPILQGSSSTGIFSFAFDRDDRGIIVGGDYLRDSLSLNHIFYTNDSGKTWNPPIKPTRGYRECVEYLSEQMVMAVGPGGIDLSEDGGINWKPFSDEKLFHVIKKARSGSIVLIAGGNGRIGRLISMN